MMDFSLEEDIPEEFKGTLTLNTSGSGGDDKQTPTTTTTVTVVDNSATTQISGNNNNNCGWSSGLIASIPQRTLTARTNHHSTSFTLPTNTTSMTFDTGFIFCPTFCDLVSGGLFTKKEKDEHNKQVVQQAITPTIENPNEFFTFREGVVEKAIKECVEQFLDDGEDGGLLGCFLLTQINSWDTDKERLLLITPKALVIVKYDFIALKRLEYKKLPLDVIDTIIIGDLVYPPSSLAPHIKGVAEGISNVLQSCVFEPWSKREGRSLSAMFHPRSRNMRGVRLMWNKNQPLDFKTKWNPFNNNIPFCTFTFHPLYFHQECDEEKQKLYDLDSFADKICAAVTNLQRSNSNNEENCIIHHKDILLENYFSVGSAIHNQNLLGFFKVRGKFSF